MPNPAITIKAIGFDELAKGLRDIDIPKASQEGLEAFAFGVERYSKIESPVDTGRLRGSITTDIGNLRAVVAPHVDYAIFVHEGTRFMGARPFMALGLASAESIFFRSNSPFYVALQKEISSKLQ